MEKDYLKFYEDKKFLDKTEEFSRKIGKKLLEPLFVLYYMLADEKTSIKSKMFIISALGYFIMPMDIIPDMVPVLGYSDDLTLVLKTLQLLSKNIKDEHKKSAKNKVEKLIK